MSTDNPNPDFDEIANMYWRLGVMSSPSQLQGYLLGLLAVAHPVADAQWLELAATFIDPVEPPAEADRQSLLEMLAVARRELLAGGMELSLLLPDDAVEISQRVDCLSQWCQGFLAGFALGGKYRQAQYGPQHYPRDVSESLSDMATISQAVLGDGDEDEQQREQSFFDISEYLRLAAINIYLECERMSAEVNPKAEAPVDSSPNSPAQLFSKPKPSDKLH